MHRWLWLALFVSPSAFARDLGDLAWLSQETDSVRFVDAKTPGPSFRQGQRVTVLVVEGDKTRVYSGRRYGWVPTATLVDADPNSDTPVVPLTPVP